MDLFGGGQKNGPKKGKLIPLIVFVVANECMYMCCYICMIYMYIYIYVCIQYMIYIIVAAVVIVLRSSPSSFSKKQKDSKTDHCLGPKTMPKKKPRNVTQEIDENSFEKKTSCGYFCLKCWNLLFGKKKTGCDHGRKDPPLAADKH